MKAVALTRYGPPDVLEVVDMPKPSPQAHEVLIKIQAGVVGPADCAFRKADPFIIRLIYGLRKPKFNVLGTEFAGEIEAVGTAVTRFKVGDRVFGMSVKNFGVNAEYKCLPEDGIIAHIHPTMSAEEAVAIADGFLTALVFLREEAKLQAGQKILINGASGSVGAYAVQLAKYYGAEVTGVCSGRNVELVQSLGADHVIDYTQADFTQATAAYDVIFDAIGKSSFGRCKNALKPQGIYMTTVPTFGIVFNMLGTMLFGKKKAKFATAGLRQNTANLNFINELYAMGKIRAVIDRRYPLEQTAEAHRYVDTERKKGNVIITVAS